MKIKWPHRLMVRTPGFHPGNLSSILGGATIERKEKMNLTWFYLHIVLVLIVLVKDYNGTLEESLNETEQYLRKIEKELASLRSIWYLKLASKFTSGQTKRKKN